MDNEIGIKGFNEDDNYSSPWIRFFVRVVGKLSDPSYKACEDFGKE